MNESFTKRFARKKLKIGLLGGSFNPAHQGHLLISKLALQYNKLDYVWWVITPQNPMKPVSETMPIEQRITQAESIIDHDKIIVTDIENHINTNCTFDTIKALKEKFPNIIFVWMMGADNLLNIDSWEHWQGIFEEVPVMVFDRDNYGEQAYLSVAANKYKYFFLEPKDLGRITEIKPPVWGMIRSQKDSTSSTQLRNGIYETKHKQ